MLNPYASILMVLMLVSVSFVGVSYKVEKSSIFSSTDNTLYVGGYGPGNYTRIQDAIENASDGDTVFVYNDSSPYIENLFINKSISLIGEDRDTTIINGFDKKNVVYIKDTEYVKICGFTIRNASIEWIAGVKIVDSNNCIISGNNFVDNAFTSIWIPDSSYPCSNISIIGNNITRGEEGKNGGIFLFSGKNCLIKDNIISGFRKWNERAIDLTGNNINIIGNTIVDNSWAITIFSGRDHLISRNNISDFDMGLDLYEANYSNITYNSFTNGQLGLNLRLTHHNVVKHNNFINVRISTALEIIGWRNFFNRRTNRFIRNYYSEWMVLIPKPVIVMWWWHRGSLWNPLGYDFPVPWIPMFDCFPRIKPYDIEV